MAKKKAPETSNASPSAARIAAKLSAASIPHEPARPAPAAKERGAKGAKRRPADARAQRPADQPPVPAEAARHEDAPPASASPAPVPLRWDGPRTTLTVFVLILVLGIVPVLLGGVLLGWWHASILAPFFPR